MSKAKTVTKFPDLQAIEAEATAWVVKLDSGEVSKQEHEGFREWRERSQRHRDALERACDFWGGLDQLHHLEMFSEHRESRASRAIAPPMTSRIRTIFRPRLLATGFAAIALFAVVGVILHYQGGGSAEQPQLYSTAIGAQEIIDLSDGSKIILNTNSRLEVRFSRARRDVRLLRGEAHFDVTPDPSRPFAVLARDAAVLAVGTAFTVRLLDDSVEVIVTEGSVELRSFVDAVTVENSAPVVVDEGHFRSLADLSAGQDAIFGTEIEQIQAISEEAISRKLAWRQGMLTFAGDPLSKVVEDVSRYTEITIEIDDPALHDLPVGGLFKIGDVKALFDAMEQSLGVRVLWLDDTRVIIQPPARD